MTEDHIPDPEAAGSAGRWAQPPEASAAPHGWSQPPAGQPRRLYGSTESQHWQPDTDLAARAAAEAAADAAVAETAPPPAAGPRRAASAVMGRVFTPELRSCPKCGGAIDWDGYCVQCGAKAPSGRDHLEEWPASWVAGVCDRGLRHPRNEDAMALEASAEPGVRAVLTVCDGVSMSTDSDRASLAAARAVLGHLAGRTDWDWNLTDLAPESATRMVLDETAQVANQAVLANSDLNEASPASCTLAIGLVSGTQLLSATLGDSRVYWLPDQGEALLLSTDDSMAQEQIAAGVERGIAESGMHSHVITRWLGRDAPDVRPTLAGVVATGAGWLLVCSEGLWNYASDPAAIAHLVRAVAARRTQGPLDLAQGLVAWANEQGGEDNITVALARIEPAVGTDSAVGTESAAAASEEAELDAPTTRTRPVAPTGAS